MENKPGIKIDTSPFVRINSKTGLPDDWVNEYSGLYMGLSEPTLLPAIEKYVFEGKRIRTFAERFPNQISEIVASEKTREKIKQVETLAHEANVLLGLWSHERHLREEVRVELLSILQEIDTIFKDGSR